MYNNDNSYPLIADLFLLFSRSTPWLILYSLRRKGMTLSEISKSLGMAQKAVLPELMALQRKDIVISYTRFQKTYYRLSDKRIFQALDVICKISKKRVAKAGTKRPACKPQRNSRMLR
jgi:predicted transcriptional regulator